MTAIIAYQNLVTGGILGSNPGPDLSSPGNLLDEVTSTVFQFLLNTVDNLYYITVDWDNPVNLDYVAIANHNLTNASAIELYYDADFKTWGNVAIPEKNRPILAMLPAITTNKLTIKIEMQSAPFLAVVYAGVALPLPNGISPDYTPPVYALDIEQYPAKNINGRLLGVAGVRKGYTFTIKQELLSPAWVDTYWPSFMEEVINRPFFYAWDFEAYPDHVMFGWIDGDLAAPSYRNALYMAFNQRCRGEYVY